MQLRKDLEALACQVSGHLTLKELSRMAINSTDAQWDTVVRELFWDTSCFYPERHVDTITSGSITCAECIGTTGETRQFMSVIALLCHQRTKHDFRNPMRFFADDDGACGACGTNFRTRLRLLDHFSDVRGTHCRDVCNGGTVRKLSNERVEELDELDRVARTGARQSGRSHVFTQLPALSSNGRVVGRLTGKVSIMRVQTRGFVSCDVSIDILGKKKSHLVQVMSP